MNQPDGGAERYRDIQARQKAALAAAVRGHFIHRHPPISQANMTRKVRRAMPVIARCHDGTNPVKKVQRLLGLDPVAALYFLRDYTPPAVKARPKVVAFNHTPGEQPSEDGAPRINRPFRNAAKAERHRPRKPGPAEQPRRARRARHARRHGVSL